jgi:hypothetical protein
MSKKSHVVHDDCEGGQESSPMISLKKRMRAPSISSIVPRMLIPAIPSTTRSRVMVLTLFSSTRDSLRAIVVSISDRIPAVRSRSIANSSAGSESESESEQECSATGIGTKSYLEKCVKELMEYRIHFWHRHRHTCAQGQGQGQVQLQVPRTITCRESSAFTKWCNDFKISHVYVYKKERARSEKDSSMSTSANESDEDYDYLTSLAFLASVPDERSFSTSNEHTCSTGSMDNDDDYSSLLQAYFANVHSL